MPSTTLFEFIGSVDTIAGRTDSAGVGVPDWKSEERRMPHELFTSGIATPTDGWKVVKGAAATMNAIVGSGSAKTDLAFVPGLDGGQGKYLVRLDEVTKTVTLGASDPSNPRKDEIYLTVYDNVYDTSGRSLPRLGYRKGDAASSPVVPGPDSAWKAYILLATIDVPAGAADIQACTITDNRTFAALQTNTDHGALVNLLSDHHTQYYNAARHTKAVHDSLGINAATVGGELPSAFADANHGDHGLATHKGSADHDARYYTEGEVNSLLGGKANSDHGDHGLGTHKVSADHDGRYYTEGEVNSILGGYSTTGHGHAYLPLAGGTMTGKITTNNGDFNGGVDIPGAGNVQMSWPGLFHLNDAAWGSIRLKGDQNDLVYFHTSTKYLKSNEEEITIEDSLKALSILRPLTYDNELGDRQIGFFAENVREAEPLTAPPPRETENGPDEVPTYGEDGIIAHLVNVSKDFDKRLSALESA